MGNTNFEIKIMQLFTSGGDKTILNKSASVESELGKKAEKLSYHRWLLILCLIMVGIGGVIQIKLNSEPYFGNDEPRHIMTAIFYHDLIKILPWHNPVNFVVNYYGHFPAIGPLHWPPLNHIIAAFLFFLTGPNVFAARCIVLILSLLTIVVIYLSIRIWCDKRSAFLSAILIACSSCWMMFTRVFMLENAAIFWMVLSIMLLSLYVKRGRSKFIWMCSFCIMAALLTKQHSITIVPTLCAGAIIGFNKRHWRDWNLYVALVFSAIVVILYYGFSLSMITSSWQDISMASNENKIVLQDIISLYGVIPALLGLLGAISFVFNKNKTWLDWVAITWFISVYALYESMGVKTTRYLLYILPSLLFLAASFLVRISRTKFSVLSHIVAISSIFTIAFTSFNIDKKELRGYELAAMEASRLSENGKVIFAGYFDGPFILYRRMHDQNLKTVTFRISKLIGGGNILPERSYESYVGSTDEIIDAVMSTGADIIVVEDKPEIDNDKFRWFWGWIKNNENFNLIEQIPVVYPTKGESFLRIYRLKVPLSTAPPKFSKIPLRTTTMKEITVDLTEPLIGWR